MILAEPTVAVRHGDRGETPAGQLRVGDVPVACGGARDSGLPWSLRAVSLAATVPPIERRRASQPV